MVSRPGERQALWDERHAIASELGRPLGMFDEAAWHAPFTFIVLYDGPLKLDLFFHDGEPVADPWLADGVAALLDKTGVAERIAPAGPPPFDAREHDAHAWDWLWWLHVKLIRGETWLVRVESTLFFSTILVRAWNERAGEGWRGTTGLSERLDPELAQRAAAALPRSNEPAELARAIAALAQLYVEARSGLGADLDDELMNQVLGAVSAT